MHLSVPCPLSTRLVTCLVMWCYMGRRLLKFCVIGIRKRKKVHCYWYVYSNLVVIIKCFFINGENRLNRVILKLIKLLSQYFRLVQETESAIQRGCG